ncbi:MAG: hypothetical protein U1E78_01560 [Gammaproteobacteria bacterium]
MTGDSLRVLLEKSRIFLERYELDIQGQLVIFESGRARADSAAMSEWLDRVYLANILRSKSKISDFESFSAEALQQKSGIILEKLMDYLSRAEEALKEACSSTEVSAKFIPVHAHKEFDQKNKKLLEEVSALLKDPLLEGCAKSKKTWFTNTLRRISNFIQIRTNSFGLNKAEHVELAMQNLKQLSEYTDILEDAPEEYSTKTTARMIGEQHRYIPKEMNACLIQFRALQAEGEATSKEAVMNVMTPSFPNPRATP